MSDIWRVIFHAIDVTNNMKVNKKLCGKHVVNNICYLWNMKMNFPNIQFLSPGGSTIHSESHGGSIDDVNSIFVASA